MVYKRKTQYQRNFRVDQPILWTDGEISLINTFGWQDNNSNIDGDKNSNKAFNNNLYLQLSQPIFTYNKRKMELKQIEYDYENAHISYALQRLNTEKDITNQFYSVYMAQSQLAITREELVNAQQSYDIIKNKVEADLSAKRRTVSGGTEPGNRPLFGRRTASLPGECKG